MITKPSFSLILGCTTLLVDISTAKPLSIAPKKAYDLPFQPGPGHANCPTAGDTTFTSNGERFGVLCGWDTHARGFKWGPITGLNFEQCIAECAKKDDCTVATFTGTCYLKESGKGKGFVRTERGNNMSAIKLRKGWHGKMGSHGKPQTGDSGGNNGKPHPGSNVRNHGKPNHHDGGTGHGSPVGYGGSNGHYDTALG